MANESDPKLLRANNPAVDPSPRVEPGPATPPPVNPAPRTPGTSRPDPGFGQRVGNFFRFLLKLVILLILLSVLSVALYLFVPEIYQRYVRPVEQNTAQVRELQSWQEQTRQELADLQTQLGTLETVQNEQDQALTEMNERMSDIETEITARTESLATLEQLQTELESQNQEISAELERQINLLKAMELLSRARLSMYQSNFGLARQDVQIARDTLAAVQPDAPDELSEQLDAVLFRLDMTLSNLPAFPVLASDDLDIAWQILLSGMPPEGASTEGTMTPTPVGTVSRTPTTNVTTTATPRGTAQPSATP